MAMRLFRGLNFALGVLFVLASISLAHAAPVIAGPHASAAQIRAARGAGATPVRRLIFVDRREGKAPSEVKLDLAGDYIRITDAARDVVLDFKLRRQLTLSAGQRSFVNASMFADLAFRVYEFQNRRMLGNVMSGAGVSSDKSPMTLPVIQAQLGLTVPGVAATPVETATDGDGTIHFRFDGKEAARVRFSDKRLSADEQKAFARFIRRGVILHPGIGDALAADGRVPAELWFLEYEGFDAKPRTLALTSDATARLDYPLSADFMPTSIPFGAPHEGLKDLFPLMQSAVAGRAGNGPRTVESYRAAIEAAHQKKEHLQVVMLYMESLLQHGQKTKVMCPGDPICAMVSEANQDSQVMILMKGLSYGGRDAPKGLPLLRSIDRKGLSNAYLLDVWMANDSGNSPEAAQLFSNGIRGNPYVAPFYKDFGDYWYRSYATPYAWFFYDFARNLPDANKVEMLAPLDKIETKLAADFPQFF